MRFRNRLQRFRLPMLLVPLLPVAIVLAIDLPAQKMYSSHSVLLFTNPELNAQLFSTASVSTAASQQTEILTSLQLITSQGVVNPVAKSLGVSPGYVSGHLTVSQIGQSTEATVTATARSSKLAAEIANAVANRYLTYQTAQNRHQILQAHAELTKQLLGVPVGSANAKVLEDRIQEINVLSGIQTAGAQIVGVASSSTTAPPVSPKLTTDVVLSVLFGLVLLVALVLTLEVMDQTVRDAEAAVEIVDRPLLAAIGRARGGTAGPRVGNHRGPISPRLLDDVRVLRSSLRYFNVDSPVEVVAITSGRPKEGKSTIALALAAAYASAGGRTLLIECDLRRPSVVVPVEDPHRRGGLSAVLAREIGFGEAISHVDGDALGLDDDSQLDCLLAGSSPPNPTELLESNAMREVIAQARQEYQHVILDTAPLLVVPDTAPLVQNADGTILVVRLGSSHRSDLRRSQQLLDQLQGRVLGVVCNFSVESTSDDYGYGYSYDGARPPAEEPRA
jgi:capsular exopolysaccharide synthesis family protein